MNFSASAIIASLVFGVIGFYLFKAGKKKVDYQMLFIGIALMIAPGLPPEAWQQWGLGLGLCGLAYYLSRS